jgi:hypothetical protein
LVQVVSGNREVRGIVKKAKIGLNAALGYILLIIAVQPIEKCEHCQQCKYLQCPFEGSDVPKEWHLGGCAQLRAHFTEPPVELPVVVMTVFI